MDNLLKRLSTNQGKPPSRSMSIASSVDDLDENTENNENNSENNNSDESNVVRQKVVKPKKPKAEEKKGGWNSAPTKPAVAPVVAKPRSRIDTNFVKLKILDASRKAALEKPQKSKDTKETQTDTIRTKLMKDQETDSQHDLVSSNDKETETEIEMIATKSKDGVLVVTTSIGSNTEKQKTENFGTQTSMPRSNVSFKKFLEPKHSIQYMDEEYEEEINGEQELDEIHERLERIRRPSRAAPEAPKPKPAKTKKARIPIVLEDEDSNTVKLLSSQNSSSQDKNSDSEFEDSIGDEPDIIRANVQRKPEEDTFDSWQDMDFPTNKKDRPELPRTYFSDGPTPWSNFKDLVLGNQFLNNRLSPIPPRERRPNLKQVTWSDSQIRIVSELMNEANALMDMFDQVAMLLGPDIKLHNVSDVEEFVLPASKYQNELAKSCSKIEKNLQKLDGINFQKVSLNPVDDQ